MAKPLQSTEARDLGEPRAQSIKVPTTSCAKTTAGSSTSQKDWKYQLCQRPEQLTGYLNRPLVPSEQHKIKYIWRIIWNDPLAAVHKAMQFQTEGAY